MFIFTSNSNRVVYNCMIYHEIKYQAIWGKLYILLGILFGLLFIIGGIFLNDYTLFFNLIASIIVIYIGYIMLKYPYAKFSEKEIIVYGLTGGAKKKYVFENRQAIKINNNRLYLDEKKLKINQWMVAKGDWNRLILFFESDNSLWNELVE